MTLRIMALSIVDMIVTLSIKDSSRMTLSLTEFKGTFSLMELKMTFSIMYLFVKFGSIKT
jgi:hypothetical protein